MGFVQEVESTGREAECFVRLCELPVENLFLLPVTCRFEVGGREPVSLESLVCSNDSRFVVFGPPPRPGARYL